MAGYSVSPGLMQEAKVAIDAGVAHYRAVAADFANMRMALRDADAFEGGYGLEGHFRDGLLAFGDAWMGKINEFIQDEWAFATFLEGFSARLEGTHNLYQERETETAKLFDGIGEQLRGDR
ncbi:MAG TPA: hypothetical protein VGD71_22295 [Kribbella sp.]|jgi:hypothetical protein